MPADAALAVDRLYRSDWGRIVAVLIRLLGDFDLAEECAQEAFTVAVEQWQAGVPEFPRAWIIQTARHKAIDRIRRKARFEEKMDLHVASGLVRMVDEPEYAVHAIPDESLRLIFTCCHPALAQEAQVALTLRTLCGLETEEIARAFLVPVATMAQRLVRAKGKIRDARIPYVVPGAKEMPERMDAVLTVLYLVFNEGYAATSGREMVRANLCVEAIRLGRLLREQMAPRVPAEVTGLLALLLLQDSRRAARMDAAGELVLLENQDRTLWNEEQIAEALPLVDEALAGGPGPYAVQAAIAALHCRAQHAEQTDWPQIAGLYTLLERVQPSPIVALNRAVAVSMAEGPEVALALVETLRAGGELEAYHLMHAVRADLLRRTGSPDAAAKSYARALGLVKNEQERRFLEMRLEEMRTAR